MRESPRKTVVLKLPALEVWAAVGMLGVEDDELLEQLQRAISKAAMAAEDRAALPRGNSERVFICRVLRAA